MTDETERLYERARALPPDARAAFIEEACRDDPRLRDELASLLTHADSAEAFFALLGDVVHSPSDWTVEDAPYSNGDSPRKPASSTPKPDPMLGRTIGRYRILSHIGSGGMATVYRASDTRLGRDVALKFLPPYATGQADAEERLLLEARAAAALEHPNVCIVHEIGETDDCRPFIAMALYEGATLKQRLREGRLPLDEARAIAIQIARGLAAAHARGIVHRDVKPGNVVLTPGGVVKLLDFGLAKMADVTLTRSGTTLGTIGYMSPEHARGDPVDHRADLWSLGVVLYEMLTGVRPFRGGSDRALLQAILHSDAEPLSSRRPEAPESLRRPVERLLRKDPAERYGSAAELLADLERVGAPEMRSAPPRDRAPRPTSRAGHGRTVLVGAAALLVALAGAAFWLRERGGTFMRSAPRAPRTEQRVLVADFANYTSDSLLADAVAHALRIDLARTPGVRIAGASAVAATLRRMGREPHARLTSELAREVAVRERIRGVIDGEVHEVGGGYLISADIVDASTGEVAEGWRETAPDRASVIGAIDRLSADIRRRVGGEVASLRTPEPLWRSTSTSLEALRTFARAEPLYQHGDYLRAATLLEEAIRLDTSFAQAYLMLAISLENVGEGSRALRAVAKAYEMRDRLSPPERYGVIGIFYEQVVGDLPSAIEAYRNQVEAAKPDGDFHMYASLGQLLALTGHLSDAEAVLREASAVSPSAANQSELARVLYQRGTLSDAATVLQKALQRYPNHPQLMTLRAELSVAAGNDAVADSLAREIAAGFGAGSAHRVRALNAAIHGRIHEAMGRLRLARQEQLSTGLTAPAIETTVAIGRLYLVARNRDAALRAVESFLIRCPLDSLDVLDRPYLLLARFFAEAGRPARASEILALYDRNVPPSFRGPARWWYSLSRAAVGVAEGKPQAALADLEVARHEYPTRQELFDDSDMPVAVRPELARAYDRVGVADSAIDVYERYLAARHIGRASVDGFELAGALVRLAELYEARGDRSAASRYYLRFAELWNGADAALQPRVRAARKRAAELAPRG